MFHFKSSPCSLCYLSNPMSYVLQNVFIEDQNLVIEDVDFCNSHLVLITREGRNYGICSVALPLPGEKVRKVKVFLCLSVSSFLFICIFTSTLFLSSVFMAASSSSKRA